MASTAESTHVKAHPRAERGKNEARRLRKKGVIPAVVYGGNQPAVSVVVDPKAIGRILHSTSGHNTIFDLELDGDRSKAMIVDWQYEPIKGSLLHIDLKRIALDQKLRLKVPIVLRGEAAGVKTQGGILEHVLREVEIECLPADIPAHIDVDITELVFGQVIRVGDLPHAGKLKFLTDQNQTVAHIVHVKEVVTAAPAVEGAEVAAAPTEPEVIKKGKQEAEEAGAAEEAGKGEKAEKKEKEKEKK